jgi:hypothetical protein
MILEMLRIFILRKYTSSLPEILSSGTQIGNQNYESYRSNYEIYCEHTDSPSRLNKVGFYEKK